MQRTDGFLCGPTTPRRPCLCRASGRSPRLPRTVLESEGSRYSRLPPLTIDPPALFDAIWVHGQEAWVSTAVNDPIEVHGNAAGAAWSSMVHILGISHDCPYNPRAIQEVADAMQPDGIACEQPDVMRNRTQKAAESHHLLTPLEKVLSTPITSMRQAHCELLTRADRVKWELGLRSQKMGLERGGLEHYLFGKLKFSEGLAAARVARKRGATLTMIDTDERAREAFSAFKFGTGAALPLPSHRDPSGALAGSTTTEAKLPDRENTGPGMTDNSQEFAALSSTLASFQNPALDTSIRQWLAAMQSTADIYPPRLFELFMRLTLREAIAPNQLLSSLQRDPLPVEVQAASAARERAMAQRIRELCSGSLAGKLRKRVLVITGQAHVPPLRALLSTQV